MSATICIIDTETTGLLPDDEVWEVACRRREPDGTVEDLHMFVEHTVEKAQRLPAQFYADYMQRYPHPRNYQEGRGAAQGRLVAAVKIQEFTLGAHLVGVNPAFDEEKLAALLRGLKVEPKWNYHKGDVSNIAVGYLAGRGKVMLPPWKSDVLSRELGVDPDQFERHTALGDVLWAEAQWDAMFSG